MREKTRGSKSHETSKEHACAKENHA